MKTDAGIGNLMRGAAIVAVTILVFSAVQMVRSTPRPQDQDLPKVLTNSLPDGQVGQPYFQVIEAKGGKVPWTFSQNGCPKGITFDTIRGPNSTDTLNGEPAEAGNFDVVITVTDSAEPPRSSSVTLKLHVNPAK